MHKLRLYPDVSLMQKAERIGNIDSSIKKLADDMLSVMATNGGIGLAANQVGALKRIVVVRAEELSGIDDLPSVFINPVVTQSSSEEVDSSESCLSFPALTFVVKRPKSLVIRALTLDEKETEVEANDLFAACLSHEIEHLDGITLIDKVSKTQKKIYIDKLNRFKKLIAKHSAK